MTRALVFPGQGSQTVGMCRDLAANPLTAPLFEQADRTLGYRLSKIMLEGDMETLTKTENTQPALLLAGYAAFLYLTKSGPAAPLASFCRYMAGHSLGEYTALVCAGALTFEDGLRLVHTRGKAMQAAVPAGKGAMAAVLGLEIDAVTVLAGRAKCAVANDNSRGQVVVSGTVESIDRLIELASKEGAKRVLRLPVSAPFHCDLMAPAAKVMAEALAKVTVNAPQVPVVMNVTARPETDPAVIKELLVKQVTGNVRWRETMLFMAQNGVSEILELGVGRVLTGLAQRVDRRVGSPEALPTGVVDRRRAPQIATSGISATPLSTPDEMDIFWKSLNDNRSNAS
ncbi:MAG: ACP S-malonyltransferase [Proteobacteria bacterium]|nr:ACP S-malonyltransferase [Pseudomonadota bacterium]